MIDYPSAIKNKIDNQILNYLNLRARTIAVFIFRLSTCILRDYPGVSYVYTRLKCAPGAYILFHILSILLYIYVLTSISLHHHQCGTTVNTQHQ